MTTNHFTTELRANDVLLGRGTGPNDHVGNKSFRHMSLTLLQRHSKPASDCCQPVAKNDLARQLVAMVHARKGRFVRMLTKHEAKMIFNNYVSCPKNKRADLCRHSLKKLYIVVPEKTAIEKAKQSFRHQQHLMLSNGGTNNHTTVGATEEDDGLPTAPSVLSRNTSGVTGGRPKNNEQLSSSAAEYHQEEQRCGNVQRRWYCTESSLTSLLATGSRYHSGQETARQVPSCSNDQTAHAEVLHEMERVEQNFEGHTNSVFGYEGTNLTGSRLNTSRIIPDLLSSHTASCRNGTPPSSSLVSGVLESNSLLRAIQNLQCPTTTATQDIRLPTLAQLAAFKRQQDQDPGVPSSKVMDPCLSSILAEMMQAQQNLPSLHETRHIASMANATQSLLPVHSYFDGGIQSGRNHPGSRPTSPEDAALHLRLTNLVHSLLASSLFSRTPPEVDPSIPRTQEQAPGQPHCPRRLFPQPNSTFDPDEISNKAVVALLNLSASLG